MNAERANTTTMIAAITSGLTAAEVVVPMLIVGPSSKVTQFYLGSDRIAVNLLAENATSAAKADT